MTIHLRGLPNDWDSWRPSKLNLYEGDGDGEGGGQGQGEGGGYTGESTGDPSGGAFDGPGAADGFGQGWGDAATAGPGTTGGGFDNTTDATGMFGGDFGTAGTIGEQGTIGDTFGSQGQSLGDTFGDLGTVGTIGDLGTFGDQVGGTFGSEGQSLGDMFGDFGTVGTFGAEGTFGDTFGSQGQSLGDTFGTLGISDPTGANFFSNAEQSNQNTFADPYGDFRGPNDFTTDPTGRSGMDMEFNPFGPSPSVDPTGRTGMDMEFNPFGPSVDPTGRSGMDMEFNPFSNVQAPNPASNLIGIPGFEAVPLSQENTKGLAGQLGIEDIDVSGKGPAWGQPSYATGILGMDKGTLTQPDIPTTTFMIDPTTPPPPPPQEPPTPPIEVSPVEVTAPAPTPTVNVTPEVAPTQTQQEAPTVTPEVAPEVAPTQQAEQGQQGQQGGQQGGVNQAGKGTETQGTLEAIASAFGKSGLTDPATGQVTFGPETQGGKAEGQSSQTLFDLLKSTVTAQAAEQAGGGTQGAQGQQGQQGKGPPSTPTAYAPGGGGIEGSAKAAIPGPDGKAIARTVDDFVNGRSNYVTIAAVDGKDSKGNTIGQRGDLFNSDKGKTVNIESIQYTDRNGKTQTAYNVPGVVHDYGPGVKGKDAHYDVATVSGKGLGKAAENLVAGVKIGAITETGRQAAQTVQGQIKTSEAITKAGIKQATDRAEEVADNAEKGAAQGKGADQGKSSPEQTGLPTAKQGAPPGTVTQSQAGIRTGALDPALEKALSEAAKAAGVTVDITSGGQPSTGVKGVDRTGSHRHDGGKAADLDLYDDKGKQISRSDPRYTKFLEEAAARGAGGTGVGYMTGVPDRAHIGITGKEAIVGKGLGVYKGNAAERAAVERGLERFYAGVPASPQVADRGVPTPPSRPSTAPHETGTAGKGPGKGLDAPYDPGRAAGKGVAPSKGPIELTAEPGDKGRDPITEEPTSPKGTTNPAEVGPPGLLVQPGQTTKAAPELSGPAHVSPDVGRPGATQFAPPGAEALGKGFLGPTLYGILSGLAPDLGRPGVETPQIAPPSFVGPTPASGRFGLNDMGLPNQPGIVDVIQEQQAPSLPSIDPGGLQGAQRGQDVVAEPPTVEPPTIDLPTITNEKTAPTEREGPDLPTTTAPGREAPLVSETPGILGVIAEALGLDGGEVRQLKDLSRATGIPVETILAMAKKLADDTGVSMEMALQIVMQSQTQMDQVGSFA